MKTVSINNKHEVVFYDNPKQMPLRRYQKHNKHFMIACQVGENIEDYTKKHSRAIGYVKHDNKKAALVELTNQQQCVYNALQEYSPINLALAAMVYSIDGEVVDFYDEQTLLGVEKRLSDIGFTKEMLEDNLYDVKKKLKIN